MKNIRKRVISLALTLIISLLALYVEPAKEAGASTVYITVESFAKYLTKELGLSSIKGSESSGYVNALIDKGIIVDGDFKSFTGELTRGDAMVLLNRADEYLYGDTLDPELVQLAIDKRISDIDSVKGSKKEDVAKAYLKGYVKGYSNGNYSTDRNMKVNSKITKDGVLGCLKMLKNKSLRAKISPDGQLIRTTNLPKYAKYYPYILASFPNSFYDWKFQYETHERIGTRPDGSFGEIPYVNLEDYASPADLAKKPSRFDSDVTDKYFDVWVDKVRTHLECVFNVDYRTIGEDWAQKLWQTDFYLGDISEGEEIQQNVIRKYVDNMKANKTIVKSSMIAVDRSSVYYYDGKYHLRVYVKYCITSSNEKYEDKDKLAKKTDYYFNNILFSRDYVRFNGYSIGKWKECCYDIELAANQITGGDNLRLGVCEAHLNEFPYIMNKVK